MAGETLAAAEGAGVAAAFLRDFFAGEADASAAGDSLAPGDASAFAFFRDFFAGEADVSGEALAAGDGDCALTRHKLTSPIPTIRLKRFACMRRA